MGFEVGSELLLINAWFCPFAQRTCIALNEKGTAHQTHEISPEDLYGKANWFVSLSPAGLIPVLAYKQEDQLHVVTESLICNEFVEDFLSGPNLLPEDAYSRAQARAIIARFDAKFVRYLIQQDPKVQAQAAEQIDVELKWLASLLDARGPYFLGSDFSLVDCALLPFLIRIFLLETYRQYTIPKQCPSLVEYIKKATSRPSVLKTMMHPTGEDYKKALLKFNSNYADGTAQSQMAKAARE